MSLHFWPLESSASGSQDGEQFDQESDNEEFSQS